MSNQLVADDNPVQYNLTVSKYGFSGAKVETLGASEYTLATAAIDVSGSVYNFAQEIEAALKAIFRSLHKSPRKDNLLFRVITFDSHVHEIHGFLPLQSINEDTYTGKIQPSGSTVLYDACLNAIESTINYGKTLRDAEYLVNGGVYVVTDGQNMSGNIMSAGPVKAELAKIVPTESLESMFSLLCGVTGQGISAQDLQKLKDAMGFNQFVDVGQASAQTFAKLAGFVSRSISQQSSAIGTKAASQPIIF